MLTFEVYADRKAPNATGQDRPVATVRAVNHLEAVRWFELSYKGQGFCNVRAELRW